MGYPQIVITGDSVAQQSFRAGGYGATLVDKYIGKLDVLNRGMGGWNTRQLHRYIQSDMDVSPVADVRLFIIHIGTNDSSIDALQTVPLDEYKSNLQLLIAHIRATWPRAGVILLTPSNLDSPKIEAYDTALGLADDLLHRRTPDRAMRYAAACVAAGREAGVPVIDVFAIHTRAMIEEGATYDDLYTDGLHYTPLGYSLVYAEMLLVIRDTWPELRPAAMPDAFPCFASYANNHDPRSMRMSSFIKRFYEDVLQEELAKERVTANCAGGDVRVRRGEASGGNGEPSGLMPNDHVENGGITHA